MTLSHPSLLPSSHPRMKGWKGPEQGNHLDDQEHDGDGGGAVGLDLMYLYDKANGKLK